MAKSIKAIMESLTLFEKASLCSGFSFWDTKAIKRLNIPSVTMSDGPHGLRVENNDDTDNVALKCSYPATSFPPAVNMASTWNPDLIEEIGHALGEQCLNQNVHVILGPGTNIKRSPLCGRNFEYFSEDPFLAGKMCVGYINGVQSTGVGTSLKHFAVNSQEYLRMTINEIVDERSFRELYMTSFEMAVKEAKPATVMCSYNRINGVYSSDSKRLLTDILRDEWGFDGIVVSDWNAVNNRIAGIKAGMDLEMPSSGGRTDKEIVKAVVSGELLESELNTVVERILKFVYKAVGAADEGYFYNYREGTKLARKVACESMVLLKNNNNALPVSTDDDIAVIGAMAKTPRYQGAGSSRINPYRLESFADYLTRHESKFTYAQGYNLSNDGYEEHLFNEAVELAKTKEKVLLFCGLTDSYESEGYDRHHMSIPAAHIKLIEEVSKVNNNVIVVLFGGSPVEMPWADSVSAILNAYLPGEAGGGALADIIFGKVSPSGKLAESYPIALTDYIGSQYYRGGPQNVEHREGIYIGYRYYDKADKNVLFPFGYGLSYSTFEYSDIKLSSDKIKDTDTLKVSFKITNTGKMQAKEIAEVYVSDKVSTIFRPVKELKGFKKVDLAPSESVIVEIELDKRSFAYYNTDIKDWHVESGEFDILVGASSRDIKLTATVDVESTAKDVVEQDFRESMPTYYDLVGKTEIPDSEYYALYKDEVPHNVASKRGEFNMNTTVGEMKCCIVGKIFMRIAPAIIKGEMPDADMTTMLMLQQGMEEMPLRALNGVTSGLLEQQFLVGMLLWGNKHRMRGLGNMIQGLIRSLKNLSSVKTDSRVKVERKKYREQVQALKEEQRLALSSQKSMLEDLKGNLEELKRLRKEVYNDDTAPIETMEFVKKHEEKIAALKADIENTKESNKDTFEEFKAHRKEDLHSIKEEEKEIRAALKKYMDDLDALDKTSTVDTSNVTEKKTTLFALTRKLKTAADIDVADATETADSQKQANSSAKDVNKDNKNKA